jgi:hypothetical protein
MNFSGESAGDQGSPSHCQRICSMVQYESEEFLHAAELASSAAHDPLTGRLRVTKEAIRRTNDAAEWAEGLRQDLLDLPPAEARAECPVGSCALTILDVEQIAKF